MPEVLCQIPMTAAIMITDWCIFDFFIFRDEESGQVKGFNPDIVNAGKNT